MARPSGSTASAKATEVAASTKAEVTTAELQEQISALKSDIANLTQTFKDLGAARAKEAKSQAELAYNDAVSKGKAQAQHISDQAQSAISQAEEKVRENPTAALGIAAGIGFVVGLLTSRR